MRSAATVLIVALVGCTRIEPARPAEPVESPNACLPATLDQFTGQPATAELGARMLRTTGKTVLRWVQPGMMVTMDFREDRLTVYLDAAGKIERANCG